MSQGLGPLFVAVDCSKCGKHTEGERGTDDTHRCGKCGRFAEEAEDYCVEHNVDEAKLPRGYDRCPKCKQKERVEAERQEMMERRADPNMHTMVDAPRR